MKAEYDWAEVPYPTSLAGQAQPNTDTDEEHGAHVFLYVPDLSVDTGWSTHRVPERKAERAERRVGFRR